MYHAQTTMQFTEDFSDALSTLACERETSSDAKTVWKLIAEQIDFTELMRNPQIPESFIHALQWEYMTTGKWGLAHELHLIRPTDLDGLIAMDAMRLCYPIPPNLGEIAVWFGLTADTSPKHFTLLLLSLTSDGNVDELGQVLGVFGRSPKIAAQVAETTNRRLDSEGLGPGVLGNCAPLGQTEESRAAIEACLSLLRDATDDA